MAIYTSTLARQPRIDYSNISGVRESRVVLSCGSMARKHGFGTNWNHLRVGIRVQMDAGYTSSIASGFNTQFWMGFSNGDGSGDGSLATGSLGNGYVKNLIAIFNGPSTWNYTAAAGSNMSYWNATGNTVIFTGLNGSLNFSTTFGGGMFFGADQAQPTRRMEFLDITKSGGNMTTTGFMCNSVTAAPDVTANDFRTQMSASTPSFTNHQFVAGPTVAMTESNGTLDTAFAYWTWAFPQIYVYDFAVVRFS